jgi:hypothetical protein
MRRVVTILLTAVLGSNLFIAAAVARDRGKIGLGRHTNYYGSAVHHGKFWRGAAYHAYEPHCHMVRTQNIPLGHSVSLSSLRRAGPNERARPHGEARKQQAVAVKRSKRAAPARSARGCLTYLPRSDRHDGAANVALSPHRDGFGRSRSGLLSQAELT